MRFNNIGIEPIQNIVETLDNAINSGLLDQLVETHVKQTNSQPKRLAIVKYHPNTYFGLLEDYLNSGWVDEQTHIRHQTTTISKTIFDSQESNYVLAFVSLYPEENETKLEPIGDRLLYISESDKKDFFEAYKHADKDLILSSPSNI